MIINLKETGSINEDIFFNNILDENREIESIVLGLKPCEESEQSVIEAFLHKLEVIIPDAKDFSKIDQLLSVYRRWESYLLVNKNIIFPGTVSFNFGRRNRSDSRAEQLIQNLGKIYDASKDLGIESIIANSNMYFENEDEKFLDGLNKATVDAIIACHKAGELINNNGFNEAQIVLNEYCDSILSQQELNNIQLYLYSFALHLKGNICHAKKEYSQAEYRYQQSLKIKNRINAPELQKYQTKMNLALVISHRDINEAFEKMAGIYNGLFSDIENRNQLRSLSRDMRRIYSVVASFCGYWMCASHNNKNTGEDLLEKSYDVAGLNEDFVRQLIIVSLLKSLNKNIGSYNVVDIYKKIPQNEKQHPMLKIYASEEVSILAMKVKAELELKKKARVKKSEELELVM